MQVFESVEDKLNVQYKADFLTTEKATKCFNILERKLVYNSAEESKVTVFGKQYNIARKQVAYGEPSTFYTFAGVTVNAIDWSSKDDIICKVIRNIRRQVQLLTGKTFNFVLINRYADGEDRIGAHRDDEKELGDNPIIVGVSFGASRDVVFAPYKFVPEKLERFSINLAHGSVFIMYPPTNIHWTHEIPKRAKVNSPRISLTFRNMVITK